MSRLKPTATKKKRTSKRSALKILYRFVLMIVHREKKKSPFPSEKGDGGRVCF